MQPNVRIDSNKKHFFATLALFLDHPLVYKTMKTFRSKLGLVELVKYENFNFDNFVNTTLWQATKGEFFIYIQHEASHLDLEKQLVSVPSNFDDNVELVNKRLHRDLTRYLIDSAFTTLLNKLSKAEVYKTALVKAFICGVVKENDFSGILLSGRFDQIQRDRNWYCQNQLMGFSQASIASKSNEDEKTVQKAIARYQRKLFKYNP